MISDEIKYEFCEDVMSHVKKTESTYMDAVLYISEKNGFGPELGAKLISKPIIEKIRIEGEDFNLLPKNTKLPI